MRRFEPIVTGILTMLGVPGVVTGGVGALRGVAELSPRRVPALDRFVVKASDELAAISPTEGRGLSEDDQQAVETRLAEALSARDPEKLLVAAVLGYDAFRDVVVTPELSSGLGWDGREYVVRLVSAVHGLIDGVAREPEFYAIASEQAIRAIVRGLQERPTADDVQRMIDGLKVELEGRPTQWVLGDRPALAAHWVDREELNKLADALADDGTVTVCALQGMRGVGKSQLASAFAQECENAGWPFVGWVTASSSEQAVSELAGLAWRSSIALPDDSPTDAVSKLRTWLSAGRDEGRLLVLDNVEDADHVKDVIPRGRGMRVILTSTQHSTDIGTQVDVGAYTPEQAVTYLIEASGLDDREGATALAADLERLPVALTQAVTAMRVLGVDFAGIRKLLDSNDLDAVLEREPGSPYPIKVGRALRLAYRSYVDRLAKTDPQQSKAARAVLGALSLLAESGTPRDWLYVAEDELAGRRAVGGLLRNSLLLESADEGTVALHRLQAQVIREDGQVEDAVAAAAHVLAAAEPPDDGDYLSNRASVSRWVEAHAALLDQAQSTLLAENVAVLASARRAGFRAGHDAFTAISLARFVEIRERVLGLDHPDTLTSRNNLAYAYQSAGDLTRAIPLYEQTLTDRERVLGPDHPDTLTSRNNLAAAYQTAGDLTRAIPLYEQTLTDRERVLGPDHPNTLTSRNNLAGAYDTAGDLTRAIPLFEQTLTDRERVLGPDHPDTITSRYNLAHAYWVDDRKPQAAKMFLSVAADALRIMGPDHPTTKQLVEDAANARALLAQPDDAD